MYSDIVKYVRARVGNADDTALRREINEAWKDVWNAVDLPGSLQKMKINDQFDSSCRSAKVTLPWFVQELRMAKVQQGPNIDLNEPGYQFQAGQWFQAPLTWSFVEYTPLERFGGNTAPPLLRLSKACTEQFSVVIIGGMKNRQKVREEVIFTEGAIEVQAKTPFITYESITKSAVTETDILGFDGAGLQMFTLPSATFEARNGIWQTRDLSLVWNNTGWNFFSCCYEILYKSTPNYLYYDEDCVLPNFETVIQDATVARLLLIEKGNEERAAVYDGLAKSALSMISSNATKGQRNVMDLGPNRFSRQYWGNL